nr:TPA_asm: M35 uoORF [Murid betaherpesvirus 1]DBA07766.1 TPA_asm: M35 uoORF [Murid betaherpesvirus 1]
MYRTGRTGRDGRSDGGRPQTRHESDDKREMQFPPQYAVGGKYQFHTGRRV